MALRARGLELSPRGRNALTASSNHTQDPKVCALRRPIEPADDIRYTNQPGK